MAGFWLFRVGKTLIAWLALGDCLLSLGDNVRADDDQLSCRGPDPNTHPQQCL